MDDWVRLIGLISIPDIGCSYHQIGPKCFRLLRYQSIESSLDCFHIMELATMIKQLDQCNITSSDVVLLLFANPEGLWICNVRGILFQGRDVYPDSLSAACLLSSPAVCCCCPSVVVLSWSVSLFKLPPSPDGPDGLPPIDGIVGFYAYYANPAHIVRYASIVCILTSVLKNANWLPAIHCWLVLVYAKTVMITSQF